MRSHEVEADQVGDTKKDEIKGNILRYFITRWFWWWCGISPEEAKEIEDTMSARIGKALGEDFDPSAPKTASESGKKPAQSTSTEKASGIKAAQALVYATRDAAFNAIAEKNKGKTKPRPGSKSTGKPKGKKRKGKTVNLSRALRSGGLES